MAQGTVDDIYQLNITVPGKYELIVTASDKAGNKSEAKEIIWINNNIPQTPKISRINDKRITNETSQTITGTTNELELEVANLEIGSTLKVIVKNETTNTLEQLEVQITAKTQRATITLNSYGTYLITATQTNIYGTTSSVSTGIYKYVYEQDQD